MVSPLQDHLTADNVLVDKQLGTQNDWTK